jgi:hypothetical protein
MARRAMRPLPTMTWPLSIRTVSTTTELKQVAYILNHSTTSNRCALCSGPIDAAPTQRLPYECIAMEFATQFDFTECSSYQFELALSAMRLLPRLCHPCFTRYGGKKTDVVRNAAKRLQIITIDQHKSERTTQRKRDLLLLMSWYVRHVYGLGPENRTISDETYRMKGAADFYKPSAVYRHLRKKFGIKGDVCRIIPSDDDEVMDRGGSSKELFTGKLVADMERRISDHYSPYWFATNYVWQRNLTAMLIGIWRERIPPELNQPLMSINLPIAMRLAHYRWQKRETKLMRQAVWDMQ